MHSVLYSRVLFVKSEKAFSKALQLAPKDRMIIYSFAVTLSIKLRLLLFDAGATVQELEKCRLAIRQRERDHQVIFEAEQAKAVASG